mgnify:FL=1
MSVTITKNFDLGKIHFDLHKELNLAGGIVMKDIADNVKNGTDIKGSTLQPLKKATIKAKKAKGSPHPTRALYDTGRMAGKGSVKGVGGRGVHITDRATKTKQQVTLSTAQDRKDIGGYHNEGGGNLPKREWFGISKKAEEKAFKMMRMRIDRIIDNA